MPLELRVALPGCRSCSRCSLAVPFQQRFEAVTTFQQKTYFVVLLLSAAATAFLIAPSAYHRVNFAQGDKQHIVRMANRGDHGGDRADVRGTLVRAPARPPRAALA